MTTPRPHAQAMLSWSPIFPATTWATTPTPNRIRIIVPANSAASSPVRVSFLTRSSTTGSSACSDARPRWRGRESDAMSGPRHSAMGLELLKWTFSIRSVLGNLLAVRPPPGAGRGEESVPVCEQRAPATCPGVELSGRRTGATPGNEGYRTAGQGPLAAVRSSGRCRPPDPGHGYDPGHGHDEVARRSDAVTARRRRHGSND